MDRTQTRYLYHDSGIEQRQGLARAAYETTYWGMVMLGVSVTAWGIYNLVAFW